MRKLFALIFVMALFVPLVYAHEEVEHDTPEEAASHENQGLFDRISHHEIAVTAWGSLIIAILVFLSVSMKKAIGERHKKLMFILITLTVTGVTVYLAADTIHTNVTSETGGPVHWHVDYEIWNCDQRLDLVDPEGFSNKIGTPIFHEHNDDRIHVEGAVPSLAGIGIEDFFRSVGGEITSTHFMYPTEQLGAVTAVNGELCGGRPGEVQMFLYRIENPRDINNWVYTQTKLENISDYTPAPYGQVPPGDCLIIEFDEPKNNTDRMCIFYSAAIERGDLRAD